jgi:hypothetical protein
MNRWLVIITDESAADFKIVGTFVNRDAAVEWVAQAFHDKRYENCLLRVKKMESPHEVKAGNT